MIFRARQQFNSLMLMMTLLVGGCAAATPATAPTTRPDSPIAYRHVQRQEPLLHLHVVEIDLNDPRIQLGAYPCGSDPDGKGPWQTTLATVRNVAEQHELHLAVNANFFTPRQAMNVAGRRVPYFAGNWARAVGWLMCDGQLISGQRGAASLIVSREGQVRIGAFDQLPADAREVISGSQLLVENSRAVGRGEVRAPRTAAGIDAEGNRIVLLVVDGRLLSHSVGMSERELAEEMLRLGCSDALNLDGGGSSTLILRSADGELRLMNRPSDGHHLPIPLSLERNVACIFGVRMTTPKSATTRSRSQ